MAAHQFSGPENDPREMKKEKSHRPSFPGELTDVKDIVKVRKRAVQPRNRKTKRGGNKFRKFSFGNKD